MLSELRLIKITQFYGIISRKRKVAGLNKRKYSGKELITFAGYDAMDYKKKLSLGSGIGKQLRKQTKQQGKQGLPIKEVYKGWQKDYYGR